MADIILGTMGIVAILGYVFKNKDREGREGFSVTGVSVDLNTDNDIYNSHNSPRIAGYMQESADAMYNLASKTDTNVVRPLSNLFGFKGHPEPSNANLSVRGDLEAHTYNTFTPASTQSTTPKGPVPEADSRALVSSAALQDKFTNLATAFESSVPSEDFHHNNETPFFRGATTKQNVEPFANVTTLSNYTGVDAHTILHKETVLADAPVRQDTSQFTPSVDLAGERYLDNIGVMRTGVPLMQPTRTPAPIAGTIDNPIQANAKTIDDLRYLSNQRQVFRGVTQHGKLGEEGESRDFIVAGKLRDTVSTPNYHVAKSAVNANANRQDHSAVLKTTARGVHTTFDTDLGKGVSVSNYAPEAAGTSSGVLRSGFGSVAPGGVSLSNAGTAGVIDELKSSYSNAKMPRNTGNKDPDFARNFGGNNSIGENVTPRTRPDVTKKDTLASTSRVANGGLLSGVSIGAAETFQRGASVVTAKDTVKQLLVERSQSDPKRNYSDNRGMGYTTTAVTVPTTIKDLMATTNRISGLSGASEMPVRTAFNAGDRHTKETLATTGRTPNGTVKSSTKFLMDSGAQTVSRKISGNFQRVGIPGVSKSAGYTLPVDDTRKKMQFKQSTDLDTSISGIKAQLEDNPYVLKY